jgi:hypothetical protein
VKAVTLPRREAIDVVKGPINIDTCNRTADGFRTSCKTRRGQPFTDHPPMKPVELNAALLPTLALKPALRVSHGEKVPGTKDGLRNAKVFANGNGGLWSTLPGQGYWRPIGLALATAIPTCRWRRNRPAHSAGKLASFRSEPCRS